MPPLKRVSTYHKSCFVVLNRTESIIRIVELNTDTYNINVPIKLVSKETGNKRSGVSTGGPGGHGPQKFSWPLHWPPLFLITRVDIRSGF